MGLREWLIIATCFLRNKDKLYFWSYCPTHICKIPPSRLEKKTHTHTSIRITHRAPYYPTQRVPGSFIKPVEELVEPICGEVVSRPVVEPSTLRERQRDSWWENKQNTYRRTQSVGVSLSQIFLSKLSKCHVYISWTSWIALSYTFWAFLTYFFLVLFKQISCIYSFDYVHLGWSESCEFWSSSRGRDTLANGRLAARSVTALDGLLCQQWQYMKDNLYIQ